jgi:hypothetical protein
MSVLLTMGGKVSLANGRETHCARQIKKSDEFLTRKESGREINAGEKKIYTDSRTTWTRTLTTD